MNHKAKKAAYFFLSAAVLASTVFIADYAVKKGFARAALVTAQQTAGPSAQTQARDAYFPPPQQTPAAQNAPARTEFPFDINRGTISTIAGIGRAGFTGNDILTASQSMLNRPCAVRADEYANIYILDCGNRRLRKIFPSGDITTIAGNLKNDFPKNNSSAEKFSLQNPTDFIWNSRGDIYISDDALNRIFKVDENRLLTFFAGNGEDKNNGDGGLALNAGIARPWALDIDDDDNILVYAENAVRKIDPRGIINSVPEPPLSMRCTAVDADGNLYEARGNQILKFSNGETSVIAGTGRAGYYGDGLPADMAELNNPSCVALGPDGSVYIADTGNNVIRKITYNK
ncbi:MAG: hypothetical protein LBI01_01880 [Elusimicrobium sp.]|jgi:hypothetical protein|nr:hypothetical protein [Elusimicrobium sp.]